jgi:membrane fusion protein (multidrug efflux system)
MVEVSDPSTSAMIESPESSPSLLPALLSACAIAFLSLVWIACGTSDDPPAKPKLEVVVVDVVAKDVDLSKEWVGSTVGMVDATIRPKIQGYLLSQEYIDGDDVQAGDLLFIIDPRQFRAALDAAVAELGVENAILEKAVIHVDRYTPLAEKGAVSEQELEDAIQARAAGRARVAAAQANVEQARLNLQ